MSESPTLDKESAADRMEKLHTTWRSDPSPRSMSALLDGISPDLDRSIQSAGGSPNAITRGTARRAAVQAIQKYDPKKIEPGAGKAQFRTFLNSQMQQLSRSMRQQKFVVNVPELSARRARELQGVAADIEARTGTYPSDSQLADHLHMHPKKIRALMASLSPEMVTSAAEPKAKEPTEESQLVQDMVYMSLPPSDQIVMQHGLGYGGSPVLSGKDIAKKIKKTPAAVSQSLSKIQGMLQQAHEVA
jgi:DNA-directed RNA polymerase specialized sigma subunit